MPEDPDDAQLAEAERLLVEFLNADLDLSFTWLRTAQIDVHYDDPPGFELALSKCKQALRSIRRFEGKIRNADSSSEIHARADLLEAAIQKFET